MDHNTEAMCAVCKKFVALQDRGRHLDENHVGPFDFWFEARPYRTWKPSMTVRQMLDLVRYPNHGLAYSWVIWDKGPRDVEDWVYLLLSETISMDGKPHFFILLPATMWRHHA